MSDHFQAFTAKMRAEGLPEVAVRCFEHHLSRLAEGDEGTLGRDTIAPIETLPDAKHLEPHLPSGTAGLDRVVVIKLNGGLGTSMGLERAKSLLAVRDGLSFLDLIARQILALRRTHGAVAPLLLMNSFKTEQESLAAVAPYTELGSGALPLSFLQHRIPKILGDRPAPASHPTDPALEWCPPGHGDLYPALDSSGTLDLLLEQGIDYAFVSNADNLGAVLDAALLGYMIDNQLEFVMEAADRTPADTKGGHLCSLSDGRLALRESAQCPAGEEHEFQDISLYRYFNTNNVWFHLPTLRDLLDRHRGVLPLNTIVNRKTLDPRDPNSAPVIQLETAMGAAISVFPRAAAVRVPRQRFSPVKTTSDLLAVRSDAYQLTADSRIVLCPERSAPPSVSLDQRFYTVLDEFERRFPAGPPSLRDCVSLRIEGDVFFEASVRCVGEVRIVAADTPAVVKAGTELEGDVLL
jgi:UTP--glucose-1-phosphate uridylyltransferase